MVMLWKEKKKNSIRSLINDDEYLNKDFIKTVQLRGAEIIEARKFSSATSAAWASVCHIRDWWLGTSKGEFVSMGVPSDGSYGITKGLIYSFPVSCSNGKYTIIKNLKIDDFSIQKMKETEKELLEEKKTAFEFLNINE